MSDTNKKMPEKKPPRGGFHSPIGIGEKSKNFSISSKRLIGYLGKDKWKFILVFILAIGSTIFSIVGPKILGLATTKVAEGATQIYKYYKEYGEGGSSTVTVPTIDFPYVLQICLMLSVLYVVSSLLLFIMSYIMSDVAQGTVYRMRNQVKEKLNRLPLSYFDSKTHGEILSRVTNDMDTIASSLQQSLVQVIISLVTLVGIFIMMVSINIWLTLVSVVLIPIMGATMSLIIKQSQKYFKEQQKNIGDVNGHVEEMISGHKIVKAFNHETTSLNDFKVMNENLYHSNWKAQFISGIIFPFTYLITRLGYVAVCIIGGVFVAQGKLSVGNMQAFLQYVNQFAQPMTQVANIANIIQSTVAAAERVFEVLDEDEQVADTLDAKELDKFTGKVVFNHVNFRYKTDTPLIEDLSLNVKAGQTVAIVGPTGAGKTTLVNLLMRFYELNNGNISVDDVDISTIKRSNLRKVFGMVLQDTWLFNGTIYDNIKYGRDTALEEEILVAAKSSHVQHFVDTLPDGYNTILKEDASNLSQGQKQLLTIARAIVADPKILILDEATSNVDTRTEVLIQEAMNNLMKGRTSFVIAHRLSTIKNADLIIVMDNGSVVEQGNHRQLIEAKGFYFDLYNSQFA
ncbi:MAG: ABC transporter ATP-binding protein [Lachnospirales bacterium]